MAATAIQKVFIGHLTPKGTYAKVLSGKRNIHGVVVSVQGDGYEPVRAEQYITIITARTFTNMLAKGLLEKAFTHNHYDYYLLNTPAMKVRDLMTGYTMQASQDKQPYHQKVLRLVAHELQDILNAHTNGQGLLEHLRVAQANAEKPRDPRLPDFYINTRRELAQQLLAIVTAY